MLSAARESEIAALTALPELLVRAGYFDVYAVYGLLHTRYERVRAATLPPVLDVLVQAFLLGDAVPRAGLQTALGGLYGGLVDLGVLLEIDGGLASTAGLLLLPVLGQPVFVPKPELAHSLVDDAMVLAARVTPPAGGRCLDLCAGLGVVTLRCLVTGGDVLAVEVNPILVGCLELSLALNGVQGRAEVRQGDLYDALEPERRFDYVVANPPSLPVPPRLLGAADHPDDDGDGVLRRVLDGLPGVLAEGGYAQLLTCGVGDDGGPRMLDWLGAWAERQHMSVAVTLPARLRLERGEPLLEAIVKGAAGPGAGAAEELREQLLAALAQRGDTSFYTMSLVIAHAETPGLRVARHYRMAGGFWYK